MFIDLGQIIRLRKAWANAELYNEKFLEQNMYLKESVDLGCTFIPEGLAYEGASDSEILSSLKFIVEFLGVRHIRLGVRLTSVDLVGQKLGIYEKILDYCFVNMVKVTLNVGPIKCCGWPEYHIPDSVKESTGELPVNKTIIHDHKVAMECVDALEKVLGFLKIRFSEGELSNIRVIQPENEGFNPFGQYQWTFAGQHLNSVISICDYYLPGRNILLNSAGFFDVDKIVNYISTRKDTERFIIGLDYYYEAEQLQGPIVKVLDLFVLSWKKGNFGLQKLKINQVKYQFATEVTEAQMESWGKSTEQGNSVKSLKYVLLRSAQFLYNNKGVISLWGLDKFALKAIRQNLSREQKLMALLIQKIQTKI